MKERWLSNGRFHQIVYGLGTFITMGLMLYVIWMVRVNHASDFRPILPWYCQIVTQLVKLPGPFFYGGLAFVLGLFVILIWKSIKLAPVFFALSLVLNVGLAVSCVKALGLRHSIGDLVTLHVNGLQLKVPSEWEKRDQSKEKCIYLTPQELSEVRDSTSEWNKEYAHLLNTVLPYDNCIAQLGEESWDQGVSFRDLQMRIYVLKNSPQEISSWIESRGLRTAKELTRQTITRLKSSRAKGFVGEISKNLSSVLWNGKRGRWQRFKVSYFVPYEDDGGKANVDFRLSSLGNKTVVLAFMYADTYDGIPLLTMRGIAKSVEIRRSPELDVVQVKE